MTEKKDAKEEPKPRRRRVKKARGHGGHHGGAWKVAYADFVTAMMALFLVLWLVSQADTKLKQQIANYFRSPGVFKSTQGGILSGAQKVSREPSKLTSKDDQQTLYNVARTLRGRFKHGGKYSKTGDKVDIRVTEQGLQIQVLDKADNISFEVGSAKLTREAREILEEIARAICELPNPIIIGGHTDSRVFPSATGYTNWELSTDRANAARRVLQSVCVKPEQIKRIIGYADTDPIVPEDVYAPANRRISFTILRMHYGTADETKESVPEDKETGDTGKIDLPPIGRELREKNSIGKSRKPQTRSTAPEQTQGAKQTPEKTGEKEPAAAEAKKNVPVLKKQSGPPQPVIPSAQPAADAPEKTDRPAPENKSEKKRPPMPDIH